MKELQVFSNQEFGQVRAMEIDGNPWFVASDVCNALGLGNASQALSRLEEDEKGIISNDTPGGTQKMLIVNEPGLYSLTLSSRKQEAKSFKRWITHDVLPSIRKTGSYTTKPMTDYQQMMADTRRKNAQIQSARLLMQLAKQYEGTTYEQVLNANATRELTGQFLLPLPSLKEQTYSAEEIGKMLGISAQKVGLLAKDNDLKQPAYGEWFKDKARYSNKEVNTFRYYMAIVPVLEDILRAA